MSCIWVAILLHDTDFINTSMIELLQWFFHQEGWFKNEDGYAIPYTDCDLIS